VHLFRNPRFNIIMDSMRPTEPDTLSSLEVPARLEQCMEAIEDGNYNRAWRIAFNVQLDIVKLIDSDPRRIDG